MNNQATATVTVSVERNPSTPQYAESQYSVTVDEKHALGEHVLTVQATDEDQVKLFVHPT